MCKYFSNINYNINKKKTCLKSMFICQSYARTYLNRKFTCQIHNLFLKED